MNQQQTPSQNQPASTPAPRSAAMSATVVPESKFTQILQASVKTGTEVKNDQVTTTEVSPAKPGGMNAMERAMQKHNKAMEQN